MTINDSHSPKRKRRWYQFSPWTVLLVGLCVFSGCGRSKEQQAVDVYKSKEQQAVDAYNRGLAHDKKSETEKAIADYTEPIHLDPKDAKAYYRRGLGYGRKGDIDKAIADFTEAIRLNPKDAEAYFNRGVVTGGQSACVASRNSGRTRQTGGKYAREPPPTAAPAPAEGAEALETAETAHLGQGIRPGARRGRERC